MTFAPAPILETKRLILRAPAPEDFEAWAEFAADEETMRYIGGAQTRSVAWRGLCSVTGAWSIRGYSMFSMVERSTGRWIGRMGPWEPEDWPGKEVGWAIVRNAWGQGYATEAAVAAMDYAFGDLGWEEVVHTIDPGNTASHAVARKLGSTLKGATQMPPPYQALPCELWSQTANEWRENRKRLAPA